jgi:hypothetical protein
MDIDYDRILAAKEAAQSRLLSIPGVHAVGIGAKYVHGKRTSEPSIIVYTVKKKPLSEIDPLQVIPPEIDGIKTDVIEAGVPRDLAAEFPDESSYHRIEGGIQIQNRGGPGDYFGTLGFIAHTLDPVPKVVAVTCRHVVNAALRDATGLDGTFTTPSASPTTGPFTLTFSGAILPRTEIVVNLELTQGGGSPKQELNVFLTTTSADTLVTIAKTVAQEISNHHNPGISSATWSGPGPKVAITLSGGFSLLPTCYVFGPVRPDPKANLSAAIAGNKISLSGSVSSGDYGIYASWNTGGGNASDGIFLAVGKGQSPNSIATAIANAINAVPNTGVSVPTPTGADFTITGAEEVECNVTSDARVGQADDTYCSPCCWCCGQQLGRVIACRMSVDAALVQLKAGLKYKAEIQDIGVVDSVYAVTPQDVTPGPYGVSKRGRSTQRTDGIIQALNINGQTTSRFYVNGMSIASKNADPFSDEGDSGSAVVSVFTNSLGHPACKIVGLLFGRDTPSGLSFATPIDQVAKAMSVAPETATVPDDFRTVSALSGVSAMAMHPESLEASAGQTVRPIRSERWDTLYQAQQELTATSGGGKYAALVDRHMSEVKLLVNTNRRVAAVWQRSGGPQMIRALVRMLEIPDTPLPREINGTPLGDCLARIQRVLMRYGSPSFSADLRLYGPRIASFAGLTYFQVLATLDSEKLE